MPPSTRRQARRVHNLPPHRQRINEVTTGSDEPPSQDADEDTIPDLEMEQGEQAEEDDDEVPDAREAPFPPPGLKEISSLASWTVSTAKPGCGVAALRNPDTSLYWQSDGPQPHLLSIHFIKVVSIIHLRIYLDFEADESYTPTKIQFLAGMSPHDIIEFAEMSFEHPTGWIDVDFSHVGPLEDAENGLNEINWKLRPALRALVVQVRILENHQNGKDTHLRAVQLFTLEDKGDWKDENNIEDYRLGIPAESKLRTNGQWNDINEIRMAPWMLEPDLR